MDCPYCKQMMDLGRLQAGGKAVYWLPEKAEDILLLSRRNVEKRGGIFLDKVPNNNLASLGLTSEGRPDSYYCRSCGIFITKL